MQQGLGLDLDMENNSADNRKRNSRNRRKLRKTGQNPRIKGTMKNLIDYMDESKKEVSEVREDLEKAKVSSKH
jgi:hypothetical protein